MADIKMSDLVAQISDLEWEPTRLLPMSVGWLESAYGGTEIICDPSMPIVQLIELNVAMGVAQVQRDEILNYEQYPVMAESENSLYLHMSDEDFRDLYATPGGAWFDLYLSEAEVLKLAVQVGDTNLRQLMIPKHTKVVVNNATFTFQYPINIIVKVHDGIDVLYDGSQVSPLQSLSGNKVDWDPIILPEQVEGQGPLRMIKITTFLNQMLLTSYTLSPSASKITKKTYTLTDQYYYVRAFTKDAKGDLVAVETTHTQQVFDVRKLTLLLTVKDGTLTVEVPYIYMLSGIVLSDIRIDVYTTKGPINYPLSNITPSGFETTWGDLDNDDNSRYWSPLSLMTTIGVTSTDTASGGTNQLTFEERRARMLNNTIKPIVIPISNAQMGVRLFNLGFDAFSNIDDVGGRTYLASRAMPSWDSSMTSTGVDTAVITMRSTMSSLLANDTVIDNGDRITVTPETLYRNLDGVLSIVPKARREAIDAMTGDAKVAAVSDGTYLFTPFHYVLDSSENSFVSRPYFLSSPSIDSTSYVDSNNSLGLTISSSTTRTIRRVDDGYILTVLTSSNAAYKALRDDQTHVQLAVIPSTESGYAYINGKQVLKTESGERVFEFKLRTLWDLDPSNRITITNLNMFEEIDRSYPLNLHPEIHLLWAVSDFTVIGEETTGIDDDLGDFMLPFTTVGVYHETLGVTLGDSLAVNRELDTLSGLWAWSKAVVGDRKVSTYKVNVLARQTETKYVEDANGQPIIDIVNGEKQLRVKYRKGDVILDSVGKPVYQFEIGDPVIQNGQPVYESDRNLMRWWDLCLFDGVYRYATHPADVEYIENIPKVIVDWVNDSLATVAKLTLDETELLFQPRNTLKSVEALIDDSVVKSLHTAQTLTVDLYVSKAVHTDQELRAVLKAAVIKAVLESLDNVQVSREGIEAAIKAKVLGDVITIDVSGLGGQENDYNLITLLDESSRLCIGTKLSYRADGSYQVIYGISVNFKRHGVPAT